MFDVWANLVEHFYTVLLKLEEFMAGSILHEVVIEHGLSLAEKADSNKL